MGSRYDTNLICKCGGRLRIEDFYGRGIFRFETYCDKCLVCDVNGHPRLAEALSYAKDYFDATGEATLVKNKP